MKRLFFFPFQLILLFGLADATAAQQTALLMQVESSPRPRMNCAFHLLLGANQRIEGVTTACSGECLADFGVSPTRRYNFNEIRAGVVFMKEQHMGITVVTVRGPNLDPDRGGRIEMRYLKNGITQKYDTFVVDLQKIGSQWVAYTDPDLDHRAFSHLSITTSLVGIKKITAE